MPTGETGRDRVSRIQTDYFHKRNPLQRGKLWLSAWGIVLAGGWCGWGMLSPESHHAPGRVATVHMFCESNCQSCHTSFSPISAENCLSSDKSTALVDAKCKKCHLGPAHHVRQISTASEGCASCHLDHRGSDAVLTQVSDQTCTRCHGDLDKHAKLLAGEQHGVSAFSGETDPRYAPEKATNFATQHPEFRSIRRDPGRLKFTHGRHMALGLNLGPNDRHKTEWKDLTAPDQERYQRQLREGGAADADKTLVQLTCAACHQPEYDRPSSPGATVKGTVAALGGTGAYMAPINFDQHCQSCHERDMKFTDHSIPHGMSPQAMRPLLENTYTQIYVANNPALLDQIVPKYDRRLPNQHVLAGSDAAKSWIESELTRAERDLQCHCAKCHYPNGKVTEQRLDSTGVPQIWFQHARFDHAAHRAVECRACHPVKPGIPLTFQLPDPPAVDDGKTMGPPDEKAPDAVKCLVLDDHLEVLIPQRELCKKCHAPVSIGGTSGARFDCVECHRYHQGDHPAQGLGAVARGAGLPRSVEALFELPRDGGSADGQSP